MRDILLLWLAMIAVNVACSIVVYESLSKKIDLQTEAIIEKMAEKNRVIEQDLSLLFNDKVLR